jgi:glycosyltransferase involved in cell wall biosynthesis
MDKPAVSIGMPVFNGGSCLRQALESIMAQTFPAFELIISDNASVDTTSAIVSEFQKQDQRIRYVRQPTNIGPIENFNYVLSEARADYFMWAAADDVWDANWIKCLYDNMSKSVAISFGHVENIDGNGQMIRTYRPFNFRGPKLLRMMSYYFAEDFNGKANVIYGMYHTNDLQRNCMKVDYQGCYFGVDMLFVFDWLQRGPIISDTTTLLHKRVPDGALEKRSFRDQLKNSLFMVNRIKYFLLYAHVANGYGYKLLFLLLFPAKYIKSLWLNIYRIAIRR